MNELKPGEYVGADGLRRRAHLHYSVEHGEDWLWPVQDRVLPDDPDFPAAVEALKALVPEPEPEVEACRNCRFWTFEAEDGVFRRGWCRRRSPVTGYDPRYMFPQTMPDEWCGEHERERGQ